jgi:hypothetical protein
MNIENSGPKRPKLYPPKALRAAGPTERRSPILSSFELRNIVTELLG